MATRNKTVDKIWQIVYLNFEHRPGDVVRTMLSGKQSANQVQFRLQRAIAQMRNADKITSKMVDKVRADILLCETMNWMPSDTAKAVSDLLDTVVEE